MVSLLFIGDPHLAKQPSYLKPGEWRKYVADMLDAALESAIRLKVDALVTLGDVFDSDCPSAADHAVFVAFTKKVHAAGVEHIVLRGNHDYLDATSDALDPIKELGMAKVITKPVTLKMQGVPVKIFPWSPPDVKVDISKLDDSSPYLVIMHDVLKGATMDNGWLADGFVPRKKDFVVGGHLHSYQLVGKRILYPGTALANHWNHKPRGFTHLQAKMVDGKLSVTHSQVEYQPPFLLKEMSLAAFNAKRLDRKDKVKTYYRLILKPGEVVPDDKRVVSHNRLNDNKGLKVDSPSASNEVAALPAPMSWLVAQLPETKRKRARKILATIPRNTEED